MGSTRGAQGRPPCVPAVIHAASLIACGPSLPLNTTLQALDAGSSAAIPEGIRQELERIEDAGGLHFLQDLVTQVKVREHEQALVHNGNITS